MLIVERPKDTWRVSGEVEVAVLKNTPHTKKTLSKFVAFTLAHSAMF